MRARGGRTSTTAAGTAGARTKKLIGFVVVASLLGHERGVVLLFTEGQGHPTEHRGRGGRAGLWRPKKFRSPYGPSTRGPWVSDSPSGGGEGQNDGEGERKRLTYEHTES